MRPAQCNPRAGLESGRRPCRRRSPAPLLHLPPRAPAQPTPPAALARRLRALRPCHGACAGEQTRARFVRRAALLWTPSPFLHGHQALLMTQSRCERTIDAVALRGSLVRLRGVVNFIYGALPLGELSRAFPSLFERHRIHEVRVGRRKSPPCRRPGRRPSTPAAIRPASPRRRQDRFRCPCYRRRRRALLAPAMHGPALSPHILPNSQTGPAGASSKPPHDRTMQPPRRQRRGKFTYSTFTSTAILALSYRRQCIPSPGRRRANLDAEASVREWYRDSVRFHSFYQRQRLLIFHSPSRLRTAKRTCP
jgi:hypothetical protein